MRILILIALPTLLLSPNLAVDWQNPKKGRVSIRVEGENDFVTPCVESGFEAVYRYSLQVCKRRTGWVDRCGTERTVIRTLEFDAVSQNFTAHHDLLRDDKPKKSATLDDKERSVNSLSRINNFSLAVLTDNKAVPARSRNSYLNLRVVGRCKGDFNKTLARISSVLTFGIFGVSEFDTGWTEFELAE